ncbi:MAG: hypothetical protein V1847_03205 [Candidatus Diapherotrites archaeon]
MSFRKSQKGQTFDVFKLLISAIIAGVLLSVLLGIIPGISLGQAPVEIVASNLQNARESRGTIIQVDNVEFKHNNQLVPETLAEKAKQLTADQVCVSLGDFKSGSSSSKFSYNETVGSITYTASGSLKVNVSVLCDQGTDIQATLTANETDNPGATNWADNCSQGWKDNCEGAGTCCIAALRQT